MQDSELRDQFEQWTEPLRATPPPAIAALRGRNRYRMARTAAGAGSALAVAGLVAGLLVAGSLVGGGKPGGSALQGQGSAYPAPPGQPYVFVNDSANFVNGWTGPATPAELRNAATGKVVKVLYPIGRGVSFSAAAAAPSDRLFVLAQSDSDGTVSFAEVRIGPSGKAGALHQVMRDLAVPPGMQVTNLAVNAPATRLSFNIAAENGNGPTGPTGSMVVYNLQTGILIGSWPVAFNIGADSQFLGYGNSLAAWVGTVERSRDLLVDTTAPFQPGSSLLADSRPFGVGDSLAGSFTQDGRVAMIYGGSRGRVLLEEVSVTSGKVLRTIPIGSASATNGPYFCGVLWASANGREVWTQCGTRQLAIVGGHATQIRLAWPLPTPGGVFAW